MYLWNHLTLNYSHLQALTRYYYNLLVLLDFILLDIKNRADLALTWLYSEYVACQGFTLAQGTDKPKSTGYEDCMNRLLGGLLKKRDSIGAAQ